jgi:hypothetical protein
MNVLNDFLDLSSDLRLASNIKKKQKETHVPAASLEKSIFAITGFKHEPHVSVCLTLQLCHFLLST